MERIGTATVDRGGDAYEPALYAAPGIARPLPGLEVGPAEVQEFRDEGFLAVAQALTRTEVDQAQEGLRALARAGSPADIQYERMAQDRLGQLSADERLDVTRKFMWFSEHDARLRALAHHPGILTAVERLLGATPHMFQDMALLKPPGGGREKPWHQDNAFFRMEPGTPIVGVWIALDEATADNGCMRVIPGSHREGPRRHAFLRDLQVCDGEVPIERGVAVPLRPGGLLFFDGLMMHGTPANQTTSRRRALQFHYTVAAPDRTTEDQHRAYFGWVDGAEC